MEGSPAIGPRLDGRPVALVMQPTQFNFVVNLMAAKSIGLTVPADVLAIADEVIE
jgi:hypothetical protein